MLGRSRISHRSLLPSPALTLGHSNMSVLATVAAGIDWATVLAYAFTVMAAYVALTVAAVASPIARRILFKSRLYARGIAHMVLSREKKNWPKQRGNGVPVGTNIVTKRIIFIRHGESTWNQVFNRGFGYRFPFRLFEGVLTEVVGLLSRSSFFFDAPLSDLGNLEAKNLRAFLTSKENGPVGKDADALAGVKGTSILVTSNLRRAAQTMAVAFWDRVAVTGEKIYVLSCLQEMARNVDTCALAGPGEPVPLRGLEEQIPDIQNVPAGPIRDLLERRRVTDSGSVVAESGHFNAGNKPLMRNGHASMLDFAHWSAAQDATTIIVGGHSLWFKEFFKCFIPSEQEHVAQRKKIVNCGAVAFDLKCGKDASGNDGFSIDSSTVRVVYGGFGK